ncbi:MAG: heparin lyase I family protein [Pseudomonadota bacterium]
MYRIRGLSLALGVALMAVSAAAQDIAGLRVEHTIRNNKPQTISSPVREGDTALVFRVADGQCGRSPGGFNDCAKDRERSEIRDRGNVALDRPEWYAVSILIPASTPPIDPANTNLLQFQDISGSGEVTLGLNLYQEGLVLIQSDPTNPQTDDMNPPKPLVDKVIVRAGQSRNRWLDIKVEAVWSTGANGKINVWVGDRLVHQHRGRNLVRNVAPTMKFGIYRTFVSRYQVTVPTQTVVFDHIRRGSSEAAVSLK